MQSFYIYKNQDFKCNRYNELDLYHPVSDPAQHRNSIINEFQSRPPASAKEAAARIEQLTSVKRSPQRVRIFMRTIGMTFRKTAAIPWKNRRNSKNTLEPEIARAKAGEAVLLFMDGVHFVQAAFLGYLWCFTRIFLRSPSGRKRWNVLGAYNVISGQLTVVANDGYITAVTVCEMLRKLSVQ
jgi:hypothetical protein